MEWNRIEFMEFFTVNKMGWNKNHSQPAEPLSRLVL